MAVISVSRWDKAVADLQPQFALTAEGALQKAVPNTLALQQQLLTALAAQLKIALPEVGTTSTSTHATSMPATTQPSATQPTVSSSTSSTTNATPGDISGIADASSPAGDRTASSLPAVGSVFNTVPAIDPMMQYWAATALYQEVQLINRYMKDAALDSDYVPYVVRLQVSIVPRHRD